MVNFSFKKSYNFNNFDKVKYDHLWGSKGVFTTVRVVGSSPRYIFLKEHLSQLNKSLKKDKFLFKIIKKNLKNSKEVDFNFKVNIAKKNYLRMIKDRYMSCLLNISAKDLKLGISELNLKLKNQICFTDTLKCITFKE